MDAGRQAGVGGIQLGRGAWETSRLLVRSTSAVRSVDGLAVDAGRQAGVGGIQLGRGAWETSRLL
ncbi:hypothetical protein C7E12_22980, partial [Stenotrophomonas maltophilia]